ncbi:hypothetical protein HNR46_002766 [Haloferula luteola]|uniref:CHASE2 domain-containing protein n=1 Tax=Haloferula luteola TaxID=595692 RepID=A0A840VFD1_9BACT|nr:hypothetical protein [Haloferula luteola]MBB5352520.1 hypothetical protein [Haloferula luteola]
MIRIEHPRLAGAVVALGVGLLMLAGTPSIPALERADRRVFSGLYGGNPEIEGMGSATDPRQIVRAAPPAEVEPLSLLTLEEDPEGWFEAMPPPPSDVAVVLARLHGAGLSHLGFGYPLQWEEPDVLALQAMRGVMDRFDGLVLGFPLKDSTAGEPVAAPFLRASIDEDRVSGDVTELPVVNAVRGVAPELGGRRTLAGFTRLESEKEESERTYLLARWGDRVVFSLPLALEIARLELPFDEVDIEVGQVIRLGANGPRIPIDFRGRARLPEEIPEVNRVPLKAVIEESVPSEVLEGRHPVLVADGRVLAPKEDVAWASGVAAVDALIRSAPVRTSLTPVPRFHGLAELGLLLGGALMSAGLMRGRMIELRAATAAGLTVGLVVLSAVVLRQAHLHPPLLALAVLPLSAFLASEYARWSNRVGVVKSDEQETLVEKAAAAAKKKPRRKRKR